MGAAIARPLQILLDLIGASHVTRFCAPVHKDRQYPLLQVHQSSQVCRRAGIVGGVMMFTGYAIVIYALTLTQMAHVAALRETGVIFAAVIGTLILKEPLNVKRIFAATVVAGGIILVVLSGM